MRTENRWQLAVRRSRTRAIGVGHFRRDAGHDITRRASHESLILEHVFSLAIQLVRHFVDSGDLLLIAFPIRLTKCPSNSLGDKLGPIGRYIVDPSNEIIWKIYVNVHMRKSTGDRAWPQCPA